MQPHGTRARYSSGCRCRPCTDASSDYSRERYRALDPRRKDDANRRARARSAALGRLARLHTDEYAALYADEKRKRGL